MVSDMLLFWSPWLEHRFIKIEVGKFCFNFSRVFGIGGVVDSLIHGLRDAQNVCALTKVGTNLFQ